MIRILVAFAITPVALVLFVRWLEPRFAFFPYRGETDTPARFAVPFDAVPITTADGERLRAWLLHAQAPHALVVYFHGNGGNLSIWTPILADIARRGYDVLAVDYRGFGVSTGSPTEQGLYRDADAVLDYLSSHRVRSLPIVYWGRSLGTAVAAYAASRTPPDRIVLEAGFPDARSLVRSSRPLAFLALFSTYRFATAGMLERVDRPILVIHGDADGVIPFALGRALFERLNGRKTFLRIRGGDHNDLRPADEASYWTAVDAFVRDAS